MMDKKFDQEEAAAKEGKVAKRGVVEDSGETSFSVSSNTAPSNSDLTDWTFRKLLSCAKAVVTLKDPSTKRRVCEIFMDKPSPEQFPDYYEIVEKPIAINDILRRCRSKLYANIFEFREDWKLMFANAKLFNGEDSWVVEDGKAIEKELDRVLKKNGFTDEGVKPKTPPKPNKKLRIKLSLKTLKTKEDEGFLAENSQKDDDDPTADGPVKKKRKKKQAEE
jgi:Bromodomain